MEIFIRAGILHLLAGLDAVFAAVFVRVEVRVSAMASADIAAAVAFMAQGLTFEQAGARLVGAGSRSA